MYGGGFGPERRTAHELVRDTLRRAILRGTITGGTRLVQSEIAAELGVSTTPVREALRDLATEGLIDLDAHRGATVHRLHREEVLEIYSLRRILEPEAMRRVEALDEETLTRAEEIERHMEAATDIGTWADLNREFHGMLVASLATPRLRSILSNLQDGAAPYVGLILQTATGLRHSAGHEHRELLDALQARDGDRAAAITAAHLEKTIRALQETPDDDLAGGTPDAPREDAGP